MLVNKMEICTALRQTYVTVAQSYASSLSFNSINGPLQQMFAGTSDNFTIDVNNDGNAPDTILLDVDAEPDLSGFWSNHSNNTGNQNQTNNTNTTVNVPSNVLMYGNSYIYTNNVDTILADLFDSVGEHNSTIANTGGGMKIPQHWDNINTSGNTWNTSLQRFRTCLGFCCLARSKPGSWLVKIPTKNGLTVRILQY